MADERTGQKTRQKANPFQKIIHKALRENEQSRDDDLLLFGVICMRMHVDPATVTLLDVLVGMRYGDIPSFDTLTRLRRECQEKDPSVRGKRWYDRHLRAEVKVEEQRTEKFTILTDGYEEKPLFPNGFPDGWPPSIWDGSKP